MTLTTLTTPSPFRPCHRSPNENRLKQRRPSAGRQLLVDSFLQNCETSEPQRMTSLEIAELTGKNHFDVLRAIRKMEPAWEKVQGRKFSLLQKTYDLSNGGKKMMPYYQLTKTECLYIATKFNDEARARLRGLERCVHWGRPQAQIRKEQSVTGLFPGRFVYCLMNRWLLGLYLLLKKKLMILLKKFVSCSFTCCCCF